MGRMRGCLWLTAGLVVALIAGVIGYLTLTRVSARQVGSQVALPKVQVVVAAKAVTVRSLLKADDLTVKDLPVDMAPEGAIRSLDQAVGKLTLVDLFPGEVVMAQRLLDPNVLATDGRAAVMLAQDEVLVAIPATALMSKIRLLKPGDHIDLLFSVEVEPASTAQGTSGGTTQQITFDLLQNLTIASIIGGQESGGQTSGPQALLLTVSPQDALVLKYAIDVGAIEDIIVRAPGVEQPFTTLPVDLDYLLDRYQLPLGGR